MIHSALCALLLLVASPFATIAGPKEDLLSAAAAGDTRKVADALAAGADVNARNRDGETALMLASRVQAFAPCRELLWAGADANAKSTAGLTALDQITVPTADNVPLRFLLRCYAYLQANAQRSTTKPTTPNLVMIMEDTVNYLHPKLAAAYQVNKLEALGQDGVDDDKDGFVDDVYGWVPVTNRPYKIREAQLDAYLKHRDAIARIIQINTDRAEGTITPDEAELKLAEFTNPLSDIMGPLAGLSDKDFLEMLEQAAHGSHVAGIVLDASEGKARLHTLAMNFAEESRRLLGPRNDAILDEVHKHSFDPEVVLADIRARLLAHATERGRLTSRYLRTSGAGVANLSFGGGLPFWRMVARRHIKRCLADQIERDPTAQLGEDIDAMAARWGLELYTASAVDLSLAMYENPDVLFVVSAGNEGVDNDVTLTKPAYLARFFPNVITVGSTNASDQFSDFSNYGTYSVDVGAPGENIVSTVIPEASIHMSGTSMAAPYVSGVAALIRSMEPSVTAADLRRLLGYTVRDVEQLHVLVAAGGVVDKDTMKACFSGDARARSNAQARIARNAAELADDSYPRHAADADRASKKALELDAANPEAWRARAITVAMAGDPTKGLELIDKALALDPKSEPLWMNRAAIASQLGRNRDVFEAIDKAIAILAEQGMLYDFLRARRLVLRAGLFLQLNETDKARADAKLARELNPWVELSEELEALLVS